MPTDPCLPQPCDDISCPPGQECVNGACTDTCAGVTCADSLPCVNGICQPVDCDEDGDCPSGTSPVIVNGRCLCPEPGCQPCTGDADCLTGYHCDTGCCEADTCTAPEDCPTDYDCVTGYCVPTCDDIECDPGTTCINGVCITTCTGDEDCNACDGCYPAFNPDGSVMTGVSICAPLVDVTPGSVNAAISSVACVGVVGTVALLPSYDGFGAVSGWSYTGSPGSGIGTLTISIDCDGDVTLTYEAGGFGPSTMTCTIDRFCCRIPDGSCTGNLTGDTCSGSAVTIDVG